MVAALHPLRLMEASELGSHLHPIDRALLVLHLSAPEHGADLAALPLAERDRRLIELRRATFGDEIVCVVRCPSCGEPLEFELAASRLLDGLAAASGPEMLSVSDWEFSLRPLDSRDLAAAAAAGDLGQAAGLLVRRAFEAVGIPPGNEAGNIPEAVLERVEARVGEREAAEDVELDLGCTACGSAWTEGFDIGAHFWIEIDAAARRLIGEVAALARCFGWSEAEILAMPSARRRAYLDAAGAP